MLPQRYRPTDQDRQLFKRIIQTVKANPDWFAAAGAALDRDYSTRAIRDREAAELRERQNDHRRDPNRTKPESRCSKRRDQITRLGYAHERSPGPRPKGDDGKPMRPELPLVKRFSMALTETFADETALEVLDLEPRWDVAARRVLLAWLRLDPARGKVQRITEFQRLRTEATEDGYGSLGYIPDDADPLDDSQTLYVRRDGALWLDAPSHEPPRWIAVAGEALEALGEMASETKLPSFPAAAAVGLGDAPAGKRRRGRLPKEHADAKRTAMLATMRQHPTLQDDPAELARMVGEISESTARRWIAEEHEKYQASKAARPDADED